MDDNFELEFDFDFPSDDFNGEVQEDENTIICKPPKSKVIHTVNFDYARDLAKHMTITEDMNYFVVVSGKFVMGDFFAAFALEHDLVFENMQVITLSYSKYNVDVIKRMFDVGRLKNINLITSEFFYSHYRHRTVKYTYDMLLDYPGFQLGVTRSHCKMTAIKTGCGKYFVFHGSSNLRSCKNAEQIHLQQSKELYNFVEDYCKKIIKTFKTIDRDENKKDDFQFDW